MLYTVILDEEQIKLLESILVQVKSTIVFTPNKTPKKKTKTELGLDRLKEYRARKNKNK